jgi:hypothetical protein
LLLLQARKYLIAHSTGTTTTPRTMMGRQKKQGNEFPHSKKGEIDQKEIIIINLYAPNVNAPNFSNIP